MVLEFQAPPQSLIDAYLSRPSGIQLADQNIKDLVATYAQQKDAQQKEQLAQQTKDIEMAKGLATSGQDFMDAYKQVIAARTPIPTSSGTSLIDRAKSFFGNKVSTGKAI